MNVLGRLWRALPGAMRLGLAVLTLGLGADLTYHLTFGIEPQHHDHASEAVPFALHVVVFVGIALCLIAIGITAGALYRRRSPRPEGRLTPLR